MSQAPDTPRKYVAMQLRGVRVEMSTWQALKAQCGSHAKIALEAKKVLDAWAENLSAAEEPKKTRGGKRPGAGRPKKKPPEEIKEETEGAANE